MTRRIFRPISEDAVNDTAISLPELNGIPPRQTETEPIEEPAFSTITGMRFHCRSAYAYPSVVFTAQPLTKPVTLSGVSSKAFI